MRGGRTHRRTRRRRRLGTGRRTVVAAEDEEKGKSRRHTHGTTAESPVEQVRSHRRARLKRRAKKAGAGTSKAARQDERRATEVAVEGGRLGANMPTEARSRRINDSLHGMQC